MGRLSTHVLDTTHGRPGAGIEVAVYRIKQAQRELLRRVITNDDGRCDMPLLEGDDLTVGTYELTFSVGPYFEKFEAATQKPDVRFLDDVVIRFGVPVADEHYHVPLLISPYSYSTYRGS